MASLQEYYKILEVDRDATAKDLTRAYRKRAMQLHPDRNNAPDATQQFILLEEEYNYLRNLKAGKLKPSANNPNYEEFTNWWEREQENARRKAEERARMRYEEYINSDEYKLEASIDHVANVAFAALAILLDFIIPPVALFFDLVVGGIISMIVVLMTLPLTLPIYTQLGMLRESVKEFIPSLKFLLGINWLKKFIFSPVTQFVFFVLFNGYLFFTVVFDTLLPMLLILILYAGAMATGYFFGRYYKVNNESLHRFYTFYLAPTVLGLLFLINFTFSFNTHKETWAYVPKNDEHASMNYKKSSIITLEGNKYGNYYGLRTFFSYTEVKFGNEVTFTFERGLLGIRVMKEYEIRWVGEEY